MRQIKTVNLGVRRQHDACRRRRGLLGESDRAPRPTAKAQ